MLRSLITLLTVLCVPVFAGAQTLRIGTPLVAQDPDNPYQALSLPSAISSQITFDPMIVVGGDGTAQPWLLTSWRTDDSKVWRLTVREGVKFSNGVPLTSDAVVQSVAYMQTPKGRTTTVGGGLVNIARAEATSDTELELVLNRPDPMLPWRFGIWRLPEPASWLVRSEDPGLEPAGTTAAFTMLDKRAGRVRYTANPTAWNPPAVEALDLVQLSDQTARLQALMADAVDVALQMGVGDREIIESIGGRMVQRQTTRVMYMTFTTEHVAETSPIQDPRVRRALNFAVNRDRISALLLDGRAKPMPQLALPGAPGHVAELEPFPYDPERAKALLAEAGYGEGLELSFRVAPAGADDMLVYQQIAENLRGIGVKFNILGTAVAQMTQMMFGGDFKAEMFNNFGRGLDPLGDYRYRSCLGQTGSYKPYYCDELALEFVRQAQQATSIAEVDRLMRAVTRREYEVPPGIFLWQAVMLDALGPRVSEAEKYGDYYEYIPYHAIALKDD